MVEIYQKQMLITSTGIWTFV